MSLNENVNNQITKYLKRYTEIEMQLGFDEVLMDEKLTIRLEKEKKALSPIVQRYKKLQALENQIIELEYGKNEACLSEIKNAQQQIETLKLEIIALLANLSSIYEKVRIEILTLRGNSTKLFNFLFDSYKKFCTKQNLQISFWLDDSKTYDAVTFDVWGLNAYSIFNNENGIHKSGNTSIQVISYLIHYLETPTFNDEDIKIDIFRSNGAGGQNVNKVSSAVRITHLKTGITATCQDERSQIQNKQRALENLKEKVIQRINKDYLKKIELERKKHLKKNIVRYYDFDKNIIEDIKLNQKFSIDENVMINMLNLNNIGK